MGVGNRDKTPHYDRGLKISNPFDTTYQEKLPDEVLDEAAKKARSRDAEKQMEYRDDVRAAINKDIDGSVDIEYGGSVSKSTYVDGISDLDCRVSINGTSLEKKSPEQIKRYFKDRIKSSCPNVKSAKVGKLGVSVIFKDGTKMQYIPIIKMKHGYKLSHGNSWSNVIRENKFKRDFTRTNKKCGGNLYPLVRLIKRQNASLPKSQQLSGHNIEALANKIFKHYPDSASRNLTDMMGYYYKHAEREVLHRTRDRTGQASFVDKKKLDGANSDVRRNISRRMRLFGRRIVRAKTSGDASGLEIN